VICRSCVRGEFTLAAAARWIGLTGTSWRHERSTLGRMLAGGRSSTTRWQTMSAGPPPDFRHAPPDVLVLLGDLRALEQNHRHEPDYRARRDALRTQLVEVLKGYGIGLDAWRRMILAVNDEHRESQRE
jgi:hypothetical protein